MGWTVEESSASNTWSQGAGGVSSVDRPAEWAPNISWALKWGLLVSFLLKNILFGCAVPYLQHMGSSP